MTISVLVRNNVHVVGAGPHTLVLGHGFGTDQTIWHQQVQALAGVGRIVLFDHVGSGGSDLGAWSPQRYSSLDSYGEDLLEILDALALDRVTYVGHSLGAMVGILAARREAGRFERMILLNASPRYLNDKGYHGGFEQADLDGLFYPMSRDYQAWAAGFALQMLGLQPAATAAGKFLPTLAALRPDIAVSVARAAFLSDYRAIIPEHRVPTLIIQPTDDFAVPAAVGEYLLAQMPDARLVYVAARGHLSHVTNAVAVNALIHEYLAQGQERSAGI